MISLQQVSFTYPGGQPIFQSFNWQLHRGEAWAVLGTSGCGKTTLLYLLAGLQRPTAGQVLVDNNPLERPRPQTGLILQDYGLLPWATVRQNASLGIQIRTFYGPDGTHAPLEAVPADNVNRWLDWLGLNEVADHYPNQLSGGQRQRTAIARTLVLQPDLLLMDEPFSSLDSPTRSALQDLTLQLWREQHYTLVIVTHSVEEAALLGQHILLLGKPPHTAPQVIENPAFSTPADRESQAYHDICAELRGRLEDTL